MFEELVDRFGLLPEPALALLECHRLRIVARGAGVARVDATHEQMLLQFAKDTPVDPGRLVDLMQRRKHWRMAGPDRLRIEAKLPSWQERAKGVIEALKVLAP